MKKTMIAVTTALMITIIATSAAAAVRLKDIAHFEGVRSNQLLGYGLVVGLAGTGDGVTMTKSAMANMMNRLGLTMKIDEINTDNLAVVLVTADLPPFVNEGDLLDVTVSSIGDAESLQGGVLVMTPLKGADGNVYAVAQGPVSVGGFSASGGGGNKKKGHPTVARIPSGASVEKIVPTEFMAGGKVKLILNAPDFTTATDAVKAINSRFGEGTARANDASMIVITPADKFQKDIVPFISDVENITIEKQDLVSKIVINEKTGTIVMGGNVPVSPAAIAHGSLTVTIKPERVIAGGSGGLIPSTPQQFTDTQVTTEEKQVSFSRITSEDVVKALNELGVTASDIIAILQALKTAGALQAEIITM